MEEYDLEFDTNPGLYPELAGYPELSADNLGRHSGTGRAGGQHPARLAARGGSKESVTSYQTEYVEVAGLSAGGEYLDVLGSPLTWSTDDIHFSPLGDAEKVDCEGVRPYICTSAHLSPIPSTTSNPQYPSFILP